MEYKKSAEAIVLSCCNNLGRAELIKQEAVTCFLLLWSYSQRVKKKKYDSHDWIGEVGN